MRRFACRRETMFSCGGKAQVVSVIVQTRFYIEAPPSKTPFPASFALAKLVRAVTPLYLSTPFLCRPQINRAVHEVNDLARKNKDSIEGLAEEIGKFRV